MGVELRSFAEKCELERLDEGIVTLVEFFAAEDAAR